MNVPELCGRARRGIGFMVLVLLFTAPISAQRVLSLEECRSLALRNNKQLRIEEQKQQAARYKLQEVNISFLPQVSLYGAYVDIHKPFNLVDWSTLPNISNLGNLGGGLPIPSDPSLLLDKAQSLTTIDMGNVCTAGVVGIQPIFMGGKIISAHRMASTAVGLARYMAETKQTEVELQVEETYWQVVSLASKEQLLTRLVELLDNAVKDVDVAIKEGVATKADGLTIRVKRSEAEQKLLKVQNGLYLSRMLLAQQCGLGLDAQFEVADALSLDNPNVQTQQMMPLDYAELASRIELRSEVRSLHLADSIFMHKENIETAEMLPKIYLAVGYNAFNPNPFSEPHHQFDGTWGISLVMKIPITGIASGLAKKRQARTERVMKQLELADAREKIGLQMRQAQLNQMEADKQLAAAKLNQERAEENLHYAQLGYNEGVIPLLNLTEAQAAWALAHNNLIDAWIAVRMAETKNKHIIPHS